MKAAILFPLLALWSVSAGAEPGNVLPVRVEGFTQSLNGDWSFNYLPGKGGRTDVDFSKPDLDVSSWTTISVPSNRELKGFAEPKYALELQDGLDSIGARSAAAALYRALRRDGLPCHV